MSVIEQCCACLACLTYGVLTWKVWARAPLATAATVTTEAMKFFMASSEVRKEEAGSEEGQMGSNEPEKRGDGDNGRLILTEYSGGLMQSVTVTPL